jgi:ribosomal 50S subunit-recycling heat shock protein
MSDGNAFGSTPGSGRTFFKTRALAAETVVGRVHVNGEGVKPAMLVHANDVHEITRGTKRRTVRVLEVAEPPVA